VRSRNVWAVLFAVLCLAAVLDLVVLTNRLPPGPRVPTVKVRADRDVFIPIDDVVRADRDVFIPIDDVVRAMKRHCPNGRPRIRLEFVRGDTQLDHWFECSDVRDDPTTTGARLLALVADRHHAEARADEVNRLQRRLGIPEWLHKGTVWSFGTGLDDYSCTRVGDDRFHREAMEAARKSGSETPLYWTAYEAARIGGACPERLGRFLQSIGDIGHTDVAATVRAELARAGVATR
jgi:hypothetical protein